jgi:hypothetical protein
MMLNNRLLWGAMEKLTDLMATDIAVPAYPGPAAPPVGGSAVEHRAQNGA